MDKELEILISQWKVQKEIENNAKNKRLEIENKILSKVEKPNYGSLKLDDIRISFNTTTKWNNEKLLSIIDLEKAKQDESFPFKIELKEDKKKMIDFAMNFNEQYKIYSDLKSEIEAKPTFTIIKKGE